MKKRALKVVLLIASIILFSTYVSISAPRLATVTGSWSSTTTWNGDPIPTSSDDVTINSGVTVTVDIPNAQCASLSFLDYMSPNSTLTISGSNSLTITGLLYMARPGNGKLCTVNVNAGTLICGSLTMMATTPPRNDIINITTGLLTVSGNVTTGTTGCQINITSTGAMNIGGSTSGEPTFSTVSGSTVNYTGAGAQDIFPATYNGILAISGTGQKAMINTTTVNGTLNLSAGNLSPNNFLTITSGSTILRSQGSLSSEPIWGGTIDVTYSGSSEITSGYEIPTSASLLTNLTANTGGVIQGPTPLPATNLLTEEFGNLNNWVGDLGSSDNQFRARSTNFAGGTSKEARYLGGFSSTTDYTGAMYQVISTTGYKSLDISWKQFIDNKDPVTYPFTLKVQSSTSASGPWTDLYTISPSSSANIGPQTRTVSGWTTDVGADFYIQFIATGYTYGLNYWYIDDLIIDGAATTLPSTTTVNGVLDLTNGTYSIDSNALVLNGTISGSNSIIGNTASDLTVGGTGSNLSIPSITGSLNDFTVTRPNGATLNNDLVMTGDLTIGTGASLITGAYSHSVGGDFTNGGTFTATGSTITFDGTEVQSMYSSAPTTFNNLIIDNSVGVIDSCDALTTVSGAMTINAGGKFDIAPAKNLTVSGTLTNNGGTSGLVLKSSADGTASLLHSTAGVSATMERYMTKNKWHIISPAVSGQDIPTFLNDAANAIPTSGSYYGMMSYSESSGGWTYFTGSTTGNLAEGSGYLTRNTADTAETFYGTLTTATTNVSVAQTLNGWNCIGNPFPSSIGVRNDATSTENFLDYNALQLDPSYAVLYLWDEPDVRVSGYSYYKVIGNAPVTSSKPVLDQAYMQPGQGFLIKAKTGGGTVSFTDAMRLHENTASYFKAANSAWSQIDLKVTTDSKSALTTIAFNENMTPGLDVTYDAGLMGGDPDFKLYSKLLEDNGVNFMLQCLPDNDFENMVVPLGLDCKIGDTVNFSAETIDLPSKAGVVLEDRLLDIFTDLEVSGYTTTVDSNSSGFGRFYLHVASLDNSESDSVTTSNSDSNSKSDSESTTNIKNKNVINYKIYSYNNEIYIRGEVGENTNAVLYDLSGRFVKNYQLENSELNILPAGDIPKGIYFIKISGESENETSKIVL